ncbi:hypothetical protein [Rhizobium sp. CF122]|uniref:hypothetical protein n=1 Tax=Rhizobium sp. CF122 TaxID=1144312 RepID=UPI001FCBEF63|nr:hypothetical protein [Rhizobium sp. CF122]
MNPLDRLVSNPASTVKDAIDGCGAQPGLEGDVLDEKPMRHPIQSDGFLMDF